MTAPIIPAVFPLTLSSTDPVCATESARLLADRIVELRQQMAILLGLSLDIPITQALNFGSGLLGSRGQDSRYVDNTHFRMDAQQVMTRSASPGFVVWDNPGALTNDLGLGGPLPNCRDQAAAFPANSFVHFYWITNGTLLATLSSLAQPYSGPGPVLPPGYFLGAYAGVMLLDASGFLVPGNIRGRWTMYKAARQVAPATVYGPGALQSISIATAVPTNAVRLLVSVVFRSTWATATPTGNLDVLLFDGLEDEMGTVSTTAPTVNFDKSVSGVLTGHHFANLLKITVPSNSPAGGTVVNAVTVKILGFENSSVA